MKRRRQRGLTFITVLMILAVLGGVWWVLTFGEAYWDNLEVKSTLKEAANLCYHEPSDEKIRQFVMRKLHGMFDVSGQGEKAVMKIDFDAGDLRIERTASPKYVNIWFTYSRNVKTPFVGQERAVSFTDHSEQDLSDVKW